MTLHRIRHIQNQSSMLKALSPTVSRSLRLPGHFRVVLYSTMSLHSTTKLNAPTSAQYRISTADLSTSDFQTRAHPVNATYKRNTIPLGDLCGLSKQGVHLCRLEPGTTSTTMHWHAQDEEWFYVLEAGEDGATLIIQKEGETEPKEEKIVKGDFLAFPAGKQNAHAFRAGSQELVYLCVGTREPMDMTVYPAERKRFVLDRSGARGVPFPQVSGFYLDEKDVISK